MPALSKAAELLALLKGSAKLRGEQLFDLAPQSEKLFTPDVLKGMIQSRTPTGILTPDDFLQLATPRQGNRPASVIERSREIPKHIQSGGLNEPMEMPWTATARFLPDPPVGLYGKKLNGGLLTPEEEAILAEYERAEQAVLGGKQQWVWPLGHEGRARATSFQDMSVDRIPVMFPNQDESDLSRWMDPSRNAAAKYLNQNKSRFLDEDLTRSSFDSPIDLSHAHFFAKGGSVIPPPETEAVIDPQTGRITYRLVDKGRTLPTPDFRGMGLPEPIRQAAQDVPQTPLNIRGNRITGGPTPLEAVGAMNIPFQAAGDVAYQQSGSPAVGALTQAGLNFASPGAITKGAGMLGRAARDVLPGALESIAGKMGTQMYAVKPRGGQWLEPDLSDLTEGLRGNPLDTPINQYVDKNLRRWIKTSMGTTETDDLAKELGIAYEPPAPDVVGPPLYTTPDEFVTPYANPFDAAVKSSPAEVYLFQTRLRKANPWLEKLDPDEEVHRLDRMPAEIEQMMDYLRTQPPDRIKSISVPDALRQSKAYHEDLAKKQTEAALQAGSLTTHREYPEGFKWQEIVAPKADPTQLPPGYTLRRLRPESSVDQSTQILDENGKLVGKSYGYPGEAAATAEAAKHYSQNMLAQGLDAEGKMMGHCVGSYCEQVQRSGTRIFSLRDSRGKPHVTVEVDQGAPIHPADLTGPEFAKLGLITPEQGAQLGDAFSPSDFHKVTGQMPEMVQLRVTPEMIEQVRGPPKFRINQIKGKQNTAPVEQYLPYVQDFVKNSPLGESWKGVRDLENAGLFKVPRKGFMSLDEVAPELNFTLPGDERVHNLGDLSSFQPDQAAQIKRQMMHALRDFGLPSANKSHTDTRGFASISLKPKGYAKGGRIVPPEPELSVDVDPRTGRFIFGPKQGAVTAPSPTFRGLGLPEPIRRAAQDVPQTPMTLRGNQITGGPTTAEAFGAMNIPFQAAGDVAYEQTGSPLAGALTQAGTGMLSPGAVTRGAGVLGRAARDVVPGALESLAGRMGAGPMYAVKPRGGQWLEPDLSGLMPEGDWHARMNAIPEVATALAEDPLKTYVNKNLRRWIKTSMGTTETDELAKELGIAYTPPGPNEVGAPRYTDPRGFVTHAANPFDVAIQGAPAKIYQKTEGSEFSKSGVVEDNPWIEKLDPEEKVYRLGVHNMPESIDQMMDYLRTVPPEKLKNISVPDALRQSKAYHDALAKKQTDEALAAGSLATHREYPTGFKWQEIVEPKEVPPGYQLPEGYTIKPRQDDTAFQLLAKNQKLAHDMGEPISGSSPEDVIAQFYKRHQLKAGLDVEGQMMGHCVGSYCEKVQEGGTRIFSLRDPQGKPHVTVEVRDVPKKDLISDSGNSAHGFEALFDQKNGEGSFADMLHHPDSSLLTPAEARDFHNNTDDLWDVAHWLNQKRPDLIDPSWYEQHVLQIKGKQNEAPVEQYKPYVQDFVRNSPLGQPWGDVRDLKNTGLHNIGDLRMGQMPPELGSHVSKRDLDPSLQTYEQAREAMHQAGDPFPKSGHVTLDEWMDELSKHYPQGHAAGGHIQTQHVMDFVNFLNAPEQ